MKYDLHVHSTWSDGQKNISELCAKAVECGLSGFALTDHDTIEGWTEIEKAYADTGIRIIPGVELSTEEEGTNVHILGYGMKDIPLIEGKLKIYADARVERIRKMVAKCNDVGLDITFDEVKENAGSGTIGRPHVANVLLKHGYVSYFKEAFEKYLNRGMPCYEPRLKLDSVSAVNMIKQSGGYAVLAHPGLDDAWRFIDLLAEHNLDGVEVYHSSHDFDQRQSFLAEAKRLKLAVTAGSDYHGIEYDRRFMGSEYLEEEDLPFFIKELLQK